ncbi:hypothetical protein H311_00768 [Anncaliia algerae PRA109]|nr:hypothetical protein H311_00768 [Anncaliia algerae PRA109]
MQKVRYYVFNREESSLSNYKICLKNFIQYIYLLSREALQKEMIIFTCLSKSALLKITTDIKRKVNAFLDSNPIILGGPGIIIELDECMFNSRLRHIEAEHLEMKFGFLVFKILASN